MLTGDHWMSSDDDVDVCAVGVSGIVAGAAHFSSVLSASVISALLAPSVGFVQMVADSSNVLSSMSAPRVGLGQVVAGSSNVLSSLSAPSVGPKRRDTVMCESVADHGVSATSNT